MRHDVTDVDYLPRVLDGRNQAIPVTGNVEDCQLADNVGVPEVSPDVSQAAPSRSLRYPILVLRWLESVWMCSHKIANRSLADHPHNRRSHNGKGKWRSTVDCATATDIP